jgi:hypothetical protein
MDNNIIGQSNDSELRGREFTTASPDTLDGLLHNVPADRGTPAVEFNYDVTPPGGQKQRDLRPYIRCVHCNENNHWKGFVLKYADGARITVGKDCGAKIYGAQFDTAKRAFDRLRSRQDYLRRFDAMKAAYAPMLVELRGLLDHVATQRFYEMRNTFKSRLTALHTALEQAAQSRGGVLYSFSQRRDLAAEERRETRELREIEEFKKLPAYERKQLEEDGRKPTVTKTPMYAREERVAGRLGGSALFDSSVNPKSEFQNALNSIESTIGDITRGKTEAVSNEQFRDAIKKLRQACDRVLAAARALDAPQELFEAGNMSALVAWANGQGRSSQYTFGPGWLLRQSEDADDVRIENVGGISPDLKKLRLFMQALAGDAH